MTAFLWSLGAFIVALGILITVHEYGHFIIARSLGVKVLQFSIGFGKPLYKKITKSGLEFIIAAFPLGGYVKMLDEREAPVEEKDKPFAFNNQALWKRLLIVLAGPFFNFFLAIFFFWIVYIIGITMVRPFIGEVTPGSPAAMAGLMPNYFITSVEGEKTNSWEEVSLQFISHVGNEKTISVTTAKDNSEKENSYHLNLSQINSSGEDFDMLTSVGLLPYFPKVPVKVSKVLPDSSAEKAGILPGDIFLTIDGNKVANWGELVDYISARPGMNIRVEVLRGKEIRTFSLHTGSFVDEHGKEQGRIGIYSEPMPWPENLLTVERYTFLSAFVPAVKRTWDMTLLSYELLGKMLVGKLSAKNVQGPIAIAQGAGLYAQMGFVPYLSFLALISLSLGVINLLPIPVLDGGHVLFMGFELILRRPLSQRTQEFWMRTGLVIILGIMFFAFYNDILHLLRQ